MAQKVSKKFGYFCGKFVPKKFRKFHYLVTLLTLDVPLTFYKDVGASHRASERAGQMKFKIKLLVTILKKFA